MISDEEKKAAKEIIIKALQEDKVKEDITSDLLISANLSIRANILAKEEARLAGIEIAMLVFTTIDEGIEFNIQKPDGSCIKSGDIVGQVGGSARSILGGERVALNFLGHLSGIATQTAKLVKKIQIWGVKLYDTRKTLPGLRCLERYAVRVGGGYNHRKDLSCAILIKDNHIKLLKNGIDEALSKVKESKKNQAIEVEVQNIEELKIALKYNPQILMLDNFDLSSLKFAIPYIRRYSSNIKIEVSGGITEENIEEVARLKPDFISTGKITNSARAIDFSLEVTGINTQHFVEFGVK